MVVVGQFVQLLLPPAEAERKGTKYNVSLFNAVVLYAGNITIQQLQMKVPNLSIVNGPAMELFQSLGRELDNQGRILNARMVRAMG